MKKQENKEKWYMENAKRMEKEKNVKIMKKQGKQGNGETRKHCIKKNKYRNNSK